MSAWGWQSGSFLLPFISVLLHQGENADLLWKVNRLWKNLFLLAGWTIGSGSTLLVPRQAAMKTLCLSICLALQLFGGGNSRRALVCLCSGYFCCTWLHRQGRRTANTWQIQEQEEWQSDSMETRIMCLLQQHFPLSRGYYLAQDRIIYLRDAQRRSLQKITFHWQLIWLQLWLWSIQNHARDHFQAFEHHHVKELSCLIGSEQFFFNRSPIYIWCFVKSIWNTQICSHALLMLYFYVEANEWSKDWAKQWALLWWRLVNNRISPIPPDITFHMKIKVTCQAGHLKKLTKH